MRIARGNPPFFTVAHRAPPRPLVRHSCEATTWGSDVELEEMESEQTGLAFSLPPSPECVRASSPVEFLHDFLFPSPRARDTISFGLDDILHTAASDFEDFGPALADALPPSGQEARPSAAYFELVDVLSRATEKLALDWPDEPRESRASKLVDRFLSGAHSKPERRKLPFFSDRHREISGSWKQPFSSHLTNAAAADFTNLMGSVEQGYTAMPVVEGYFCLPSFTLFGSFLEVPPPSILPSRVGPLPLLSGSPTSRPVRQVWPSTQWPSFRPTRRTSWRRWTKGPAWPLKPWRSYAEPLTWPWEPPSTPHVPWGALWRLRWPQNAICGSIWARSVRGRCFWWTHPSHNLGYLGRPLAL